jgi:hypothetical protein
LHTTMMQTVSRFRTVVRKQVWYALEAYAAKSRQQTDLQFH